MTSLVQVCNSLFPSYCLLCDSPGRAICNNCFAKFIMYLPHCFICGKINSRFTPHPECIRKINSPISFAYTGWQMNRHARKALLRIRGRLAYRGLDYLTDRCVQNLKGTSFAQRLSDSVVIALPTSRKNYLESGFKPAEMVARRLADDLNLEYSRSLPSGREKVVIVGDTLESKKLERFAGKIRRANQSMEILSLSLFRRDTLNKVRDVDPVQT